MDESWWGLRIWKTWSVGGTAEHVEEAVHVFFAANEVEARRMAADILPGMSDESFTNSDGDEVTVTAIGVGQTYNTMEESIVSGTEVFSRLYELDESGNILPEWLNGYLDST